MALNKLRGELKAIGITQDEAGELLGMSGNNFNRKLAETVPITRAEMCAIRDKWFPETSLDYLFASDGDVPSEAEQAKSRVEALVENIASDGTPMDREKVEIIGDLMESAERCDPAHVNHVLSI